MKIDLAKARATVQELAEALEELDGTEAIEKPGREARRRNSETSGPYCAFPILVTEPL